MFGRLFSFLNRSANERIYLDYAAATPVRTEVLRAMRQYFSDIYANPGAVHREGRMARGAVEKSRETIARLLKVRINDITFTGGGTEANNLALFGVVDAAVANGRAYRDIEIISTKIEHPSILETLTVLESRGVTVHYAPVDSDGRIVMNEFEALLSVKTLLVTFAYTNSEVGVVQDVKRIARAVRNRGKERTAYVHIDASQAPLWLPCAMDMLGVDLMTLDAGKCYGPKGVGVLAHRHYVPLRPHVFGGDQEHGLRPGTESVPLIVGCAEALRIADSGCIARSARVTALRDHFIDALTRALPNAVVNGSCEHRVANNINISIPGIDGEFAVVTLDVKGVAASTRSACAGGTGSGSHVVAALSNDVARAESTIRFTLGEETTKKDIERTVEIVTRHVKTVSQSGLQAPHSSQ